MWHYMKLYVSLEYLMFLGVRIVGNVKLIFYLRKIINAQVMLTY